jgi:branched-chain amino acid transport system substrate-binding protein
VNRWESGREEFVKRRTIAIFSKKGGNKMNRKKIFISLVGLSICGFIFMGSAIDVGAAAKTLKIGAIYSLTGLGSEIETICRNGSELAKDWINEKGGITIKGEKYLIDLIVEDQKGVVDGAVAAATKLVERNQVKFVIGQIVPDVVIAAASVTEPAKVLRSLAWGGGIPAVMNPDTPYTFRPVLSGAEVIPVNYDYLIDTYPNVKTVALINPDEPGGQFFMMRSKQEAEKRGLKVVAAEFHDPQEQQDFYPVLTKLLAAKPDALDVGTGFPIPGSLKLKQARELGFKGPVFSPSPVELYTILDIAGKDFAYDYFNGSMDIKSPDVPPMIKEIQKRWEAKFKSRFMFESFQGWDALWCLVQAIEAAQSFDPTVVKTTWEKMKSIKTSYGTGHMGGLKTYGVNHLVVRPCPISAFAKGEVKLIKWYTPEFP